MARLLRSTTQSVLRKPAVVDASTQFRPVQVELAAQPSRRYYSVSSRLRPPVFAAVVSTLPAPVVVRLARWAPPRLLQRSRLQPPTVTGTVATGFMASPVLVRLVRVLPRRPVAFDLRAPTVVAGSVTFPPVRVRLAQPPPAARRVSSELRPPSTLVSVVQALLAPILTRLARPKPLSRATSRLRPPAVTGAAVVFRPVRTKLVTRPRQAGGAKSLVGRIVAGLALLVPSFWLEGDPAASTLDSDPAGSTLDTTRGSTTLDPDPGAGGMDGRGGTSGM